MGDTFRTALRMMGEAKDGYYGKIGKTVVIAGFVVDALLGIAFLYWILT